MSKQTTLIKSIELLGSKYATLSNEIITIKKDLQNITETTKHIMLLYNVLTNSDTIKAKIEEAILTLPVPYRLILNILRQQKKEMTATEISKIMKLSRAHTSQILNILVRMCMITSRRETTTFKLGGPRKFFRALSEVSDTNG